METKTLVVDVDDTISTHVDRDYANATPHRQMIAKLNSLRSDGWRIVYHTARGQLSCDGDLELIERERRPVLVDWMRRHGVEYDELLFGKPLGVYYIDDKAIRPSEFIDMDFRVIRGGSGAVVSVAGNRVVKKAVNALEQAKWYRQASKMGLDVPIVYSAYGDVIEMENVGPTTLADSDDIPIQTILAEFISRMALFGGETGPFWDTMVSRVAKHLDFGLVKREEEVFDLITRDSVHAFMNKNRTFCHGDMTLENIIKRPNGSLCLIDPNYVEGLYSSFMLDLGKILQSIDGGYEDVVLHDRPRSYASFLAYKQFKDLYPSREYLWHAKLCELVHFVRLIRYRTPDQVPIVNEIISRLIDELNDVS